MEGRAGFKKDNNTSLFSLYLLQYTRGNPHFNISNAENE
jgi:hypothetical protein